MAKAIAFVKPVRVAPKKEKATWLEAIHTNNINRRTIVPNAFFNRLLLEKDGCGKFKEIPKEVAAIKPWHTGTAFAVEREGKKFRKRIEILCNYEGSEKTVVYNIEKEYSGLCDIMLLCDQGFEGDKLLIELLNALNKKPINTVEDMVGASEILLKFNGKTRQFKIETRNGGVFEAVGNEKTFGMVSSDAALGLLARGFDEPFFVRKGVYAFRQPHMPNGVLVYDSEKHNAEKLEQHQP